MVVGVNGVGKTTTIGKLSHQFKSIGKNVILETAAKTVHLAVENNKREKEKKRVAKKQRDDAKQRLRKFQQDGSVSFKAFFKKSNV